jgi:hypothetical protein
MADSFKTIAELAKINSKDVYDLGCSDILDDSPFLSRLAAGYASNGTSHKYAKETTAGGAAFRDGNTGIYNTNSVDTVVTIDLKIVDASFVVDKAIADAYKDGPEAYIAREGKRKLKAAMYLAEVQLINGTVGGSAGGFAGLANTLTLTVNGQVSNAAGNSALTSVYAVRTNEDGTDCQVILGNNGEMEVGETVITPWATATGTFTGYYTPILFWMGLQLGSTYSVARLCNIEEDTNMLDDDKISNLLSLAPANRPYNRIVMNRRSRKQLQQSRTATTVTGQPAPFPTEAFGVEIVTTDAIGVAETLIAAS